MFSNRNGSHTSDYDGYCSYFQEMLPTVPSHSFRSKKKKKYPVLMCTFVSNWFALNWNENLIDSNKFWARSNISSLKSCHQIDNVYLPHVYCNQICSIISYVIRFVLQNKRAVSECPCRMNYIQWNRIG